MSSVARYFFIGIGGIGMSALARYLKANGALVGGYDRTATPLTRALEAQGMAIIYADHSESIPQQFRSPGDDLLVIRTPAVPLHAALIQHYTALGVPMKKRAELLADVASTHRTLAVAGTHGKTTTSSILGHILHRSQVGATAFVGGLMTGHESNILIDTESDWMVLEADEFDRSFHHLDPWGAIITSIDPDHLDIYGDSDTFTKAFDSFASKVRGPLILEEHVQLPSSHERTLRYGIGKGDYRAEGIEVRDERFTFDIHGPRIHWKDLSIQLPGRHNIANTVAAVAMAHQVGLSEEEIRSGIDSYQGVRRRFQFIIDREDLTYIDDYAHHPSEISACISAARELYPESKLTVAFQPHLYSRTRDFMTGFAESLSQADEIILIPIYPAREEPIEGVDSEALLDAISITNKVLCVKEDLPTAIAGRELEVLLTLGAGDIDQEIPRIKELLTKGKNPTDP
ncbi:MAG: UDP-N-acetylmuramate--L-alanine ligase [Flavobacteriales bacterium]|nr:UDP-N-acetylmuramate--L-alanine ligase [Flavobacteriales bacterium]